MANIYKVNSQHETSQGVLQILEVLPTLKGVAGRSNRRAVVRFIDTGFVTNVQLSNIPANKVKDQRLPSVYGVGFLDGIKLPPRGRTTTRRLYDLWANMLKRCYCVAALKIDPSYVDVNVDKRWHSFRQFINTITLVEGYQEWEDGVDVHLDKDVAGTRTYGTHCIFLPANENLTLAANKRWTKK